MSNELGSQPGLSNTLSASKTPKAATKRPRRTDQPPWATLSQ